MTNFRERMQKILSNQKLNFDDKNLLIELFKPLSEEEIGLFNEFSNNWDENFSGKFSIKSSLRLHILGIYNIMERLKGLSPLNDEEFAMYYGSVLICGLLSTNVFGEHFDKLVGFINFLAGFTESVTDEQKMEMIKKIEDAMEKKNG